MDAVLIVESDEARRLADDLARLTGEDTATAVVRALRERLEREKGDRDLEERLRKLREITAEIRRHMAEPKITSDHSWLYDEHGLPR
jgi:antitoxin VapB